MALTSTRAARRSQLWRSGCGRRRAWKDFGVAPTERPRIRRTNIVVAEPMPGDSALVEEFAARLDPPLLARPVQEDG